MSYMEYMGGREVRSQTSTQGGWVGAGAQALICRAWEEEGSEARQARQARQGAAGRPEEYTGHTRDVYGASGL